MLCPPMLEACIRAAYVRKDKCGKITPVFYTFQAGSDTCSETSSDVDLHKFRKMFRSNFQKLVRNKFRRMRHGISITAQHCTTRCLSQVFQAKATAPSTHVALHSKIVEHLDKRLRAKRETQDVVMILCRQLSFDADSERHSEPSLSKFSKCGRSAFRNRF